MRHKTKIFLATITLLYAFFASITETSFAVGQDSLEGATPTADQIIEATGIQGGLVVHLGCRGGELAEQFGRCDGFLVCGLDRSAEQVAAARAKIQSEDLYGKVSINRWEGTTLPLIDNLVNLLVIEGDAPARDEILRVLAPKGVAYIRTGFEPRFELLTAASTNFMWATPSLTLAYFEPSHLNLRPALYLRTSASNALCSRR